MTGRTAARRYARALFDVARRAGIVERVREDLNGVRALTASHDELRRVLETPAVPPQKKRELLDAVLAAGGGVAPETGRLLLLLADRDRLALLNEVAAAFEARALEAARVVSAELVTAVPLDEAAREQLTAALGRATGLTVTVAERVDPSIIGGVVASVGSLVFDGSVVRQLERMRERLLAAG